jgi:hypothetical protein
LTHARDQWLAERERELLPVAYAHVVFTLPHALAGLALQNKRVLYDLLFQFRTIVTGDQAHRYVIHDRDSIYSEGVDRTLAAMGLTVLRTPVRAPQAKDYASYCTSLV